MQEIKMIKILNKYGFNVTDKTPISTKLVEDVLIEMDRIVEDTKKKAKEGKLCQ